ncbi:MAG: lysophospholipase [Methanocella sp.]
MSEREGYLSRGRIELFYQVRLPDETPAKAAVAIIHGLGEHCGRHRKLADFLVAEGYAVVGHDLRGAGRSGGRRGHVGRFGEYLDDLGAVLAAAAPDLPEGPPFILGQSLGGLIAAAYALAFPDEVRGAILCSPGLKNRHQPPAWKDAAAHLLSRLVPGLSLATELPLAHLAHDPAVEREYRADPLCCGKASARWYIEFLRAGNEVRRRATEFRVPVLLFQGGADVFVDPEANLAFFNALGTPGKTLAFYPDAYHEVFNDDCAGQARAELLAWLESQTSSQA